MIYMTDIKKAYEIMGDKNEKLYKPILEKKYGILYKTLDKYARNDFLGETFAGELKSRDGSIKDFKETMIGYNKIQDGFKKLEWYKDHMPNYKYYCWFAFKEGLYAWELNKVNYDKNGGDIMKKFSGTNKRGFDEYIDHYYIKTEFLEKIDDTPPYIHPLVVENTLKYKKYKPITRGVCFLKLSKEDLEN